MGLERLFSSRNVKNFISLAGAGLLALGGCPRNIGGDDGGANTNVNHNPSNANGNSNRNTNTNSDNSITRYVLPSNGARGVSSQNLTLDWPDIEGAVTYTVLLDRSENELSGGDKIGDVNESQITVDSLSANTDYKWAFQSAGFGNSGSFDSPVFSFTTGSMPDLFSQIKSGIYESSEVKADNRSIIGGEEFPFQMTIYHAIAFDSGGYPWAVGNDGALVRVVRGMTNEDEYSGTVDTIREVVPFGAGVRIVSDTRTSIFGEGTRTQTYLWQPNGKVAFDGELRVYDDAARDNGLESDYSGTLEKVMNFP